MLDTHMIRRSVSEPVSDETLIASMATGDEQAAVTFVRRYQRRIFGLAKALLGDDTLAEEVSQETLLRVWRHAQIFDVRRGSATTWVLTITRNLSIDALRLRRAIAVDPEELVGLIGRDQRAERSFEQATNQAMIGSALVALPVEQRRAVVLATLYGYTADEVASREQIPLGTAKSRIRLGLSRLRADLGSHEEQL